MQINDVNVDKSKFNKSVNPSEIRDFADYVKDMKTASTMLRNGQINVEELDLSPSGLKDGISDARSRIDELIIKRRNNYLKAVNTDNDSFGLFNNTTIDINGNELTYDRKIVEDNSICYIDNDGNVIKRIWTDEEGLIRVSFADGFKYEDKVYLVDQVESGNGYRLERRCYGDDGSITIYEAYAGNSLPSVNSDHSLKVFNKKYDYFISSEILADGSGIGYDKYSKNGDGSFKVKWKRDTNGDTYMYDVDKYAYMKCTADGARLGFYEDGTLGKIEKFGSGKSTITTEDGEEIEYYIDKNGQSIVNWYYPGGKLLKRQLIGYDMNDGKQRGLMDTKATIPNIVGDIINYDENGNIVSRTSGDGLTKYEDGRRIEYNMRDVVKDSGHFDTSDYRSRVRDLLGYDLEHLGDSIVEYYDENGNLEKVTSIEDDSNDDGGSKIFEREFYKNGNRVDKWNYYDKNGNITSQYFTSFEHSSSNTLTKDVKFDDKGNIQTEVYTLQNGNSQLGKITRNYDEFGHMISEADYSPDGQYVKNFDTNGNVESFKSYVISDSGSSYVEDINGSYQGCNIIENNWYNWNSEK